MLGQLSSKRGYRENKSETYISIRGKPPRYSNDLIVIKQYKSGMPMADIASKNQIGLTTVFSILKRNGICRNRSFHDYEKGFFERVEKTSSCWIWVGGKHPRGYGVYKSKRAHRVSYEMHIGPIQKNMVIMHICDNTSCVNPEHLKQGTDMDNMHDMISKKRKPVGEKVKTAKLNNQQVIEIFHSKEKTINLSTKYNVAASTIVGIRGGKTWKALTIKESKANE
jgi:hypothetical protein